MAYATQVCLRPEGGGIFAPALGGGSGANRIAGDPVAPVTIGRGLAERNLDGGNQ
ncbi:hypothetical protein [Thioclava sp. JE_KL1]|uniref:hypothetical protein n=1 Tax=Thioclava sp. JE_KL1 TaxID=2651187 RepID=UPI001562CE86|nr:hypothetical protein [Thioclava sp. JE_KL1]